VYEILENIIASIRNFENEDNYKQLIINMAIALQKIKLIGNGKKVQHAQDAVGNMLEKAILNATERTTLFLFAAKEASTSTATAVSADHKADASAPKGTAQKLASSSGFPPAATAGTAVAGARSSSAAATPAVSSTSLKGVSQRMRDKNDQVTFAKK
jgi:hypothetical protein